MLDTAIPFHADTGWAPDAAADFGAATALLRSVLEHVDYGLALIDLASRRIRLSNSAAMRALGDERMGGLALVGGQVRARNASDERRFERAVAQAANGVRELLHLSARDGGTTVAVVPMGDAAHPQGALLVFAKTALCDRSALALFARACELTAAESSVLAAVCTGLKPNEVARQNGVQVTTIRSQIQSIRQKTRCGSLRELLQTVSRLPPVARQYS